MALLLLLGSACGEDPAYVPGTREKGSARLDVDLAPPTVQATKTGLLLLPAREGDAYAPVLYVPSTYVPETPHPLLVLLHGASGTGMNVVASFHELAEARGLILLAPSATRSTWDFSSLGKFGPDIAVLERALEGAMTYYRIDPERIALGGFSDGGSYALSVGLTNGDLFHQLVAYSPGYMEPTARVGKPRVFVAHGRQDDVLPFARVERHTTQLTEEGYAVTWRPFDGAHEMPLALREEGLDQVLLP